MAKRKVRAPGRAIELEWSVTPELVPLMPAGTAPGLKPRAPA